VGCGVRWGIGDCPPHPWGLGGGVILGMPRPVLCGALTGALLLTGSAHRKLPPVLLVAGLTPGVSVT